MPTHLEAIEGPGKGRKVEIPVGKTVSVGRSPRSMVQFAEDEWMSGLHFAVGLRNGSLQVANLSTTNGTALNGENIQTAMLKPGDQIKAGQTVFVARAPAESPFPAVVRIGSWGFGQIPEGWNFIEGVGFRYPITEPFRPNMLAVEEEIPKDHSLEKYVELQMKIGKERIPGADFKGPVETKVAGADAALALGLSAPAAQDKGPAIQQQIYAVHSNIVGVFTATSLEMQAQILRPAIREILSGLSFFHT